MSQSEMSTPAGQGDKVLALPAPGSTLSQHRGSSSMKKDFRISSNKKMSNKE